MHRAAEVAEHDVARRRSPARTGRGAGSPRSRPRRRSRSWRARGRRRACARRARGARRCSRAAGERAASASPRRCRRRRAPRARSASTSAASFTTRSGPVTSIARRNATSGKRVLQLEDEPRPGLVADAARSLTPCSKPATTPIGSSVSSHGSHARRRRVARATRGASSRGITSTAGRRRPGPPAS